MDVEEQYKQWLENTPLKPEGVLHDDSWLLFIENCWRQVMRQI